MTPKTARPDAIPLIPMVKTAAVTKNRIGYTVHYKHGIALMERGHSRHLTLRLAERAARRFTRLEPAPAVVSRFSNDL
jgi:hypothetical protein